MIPAETVADVRSRHELVAFIESAGVKLRRRGRDHVGLCPFHNDTEPSLSVSATKQWWCCLGACSAGGKKLGGDVIEFARRLWSVSFVEAVARLGGETTAQLTTSRPKLRVVKKTNGNGNGDGTHERDLLPQVVGYYHQTLSSSLPAKQYLMQRGITNPDLITALQIGYADGSLMERAPEGSETWNALAARGVITGNGRELMNGCITVPLRDLHGNVVGLYGRAVERDQHLYLPGPHRGLVNAGCAATTDELVIAESILDALSFLETGISNVVPIYGVNGWTPDHDALLDHHRVRRVVLSLDNDEAGHTAASALTQKLTARGVAVRVVQLPAKDANELLVRDGVVTFATTWKQLIAPPAPVPIAATAAKEKSTSPDVALDADSGSYTIRFESRTYRVRGLSAFGVDRLRVNVRVEDGSRFHVDTLDLYAARTRKTFIEATADVFRGGPATLPVIASEIAVVIETLEAQRLSLRSEGKKNDNAKVAMSAADRDEALRFLRDPKLLDHLRDDFASVGCVGEESSMLIGYLAAISRKLDEPLAVLFCARSGAGKSNMQDRITDFIPPEELIRYTRITGQALFYQDEDALKHKVLALDEEGGATDAIYSLRILQSSGSLSVSATRTDPETGKHRAEHYEVHGPTSIFLTTAHPEALAMS